MCTSKANMRIKMCNDIVRWLHSSSSNDVMQVHPTLPWKGGGLLREDTWLLLTLRFDRCSSFSLESLLNAFILRIVVCSVRMRKSVFCNFVLASLTTAQPWYDLFSYLCVRMSVEKLYCAHTVPALQFINQNWFNIGVVEPDMCMWA